MATISQLLHHRQLVPVCPAAQTATRPALHPPSQTTARHARTPLVAVLASDTASREAATESSSTVEAHAAATATIRPPAVPPMRKNTELAAPAEMESWSADDDPILNRREGGCEEEKHTSRSFVAAIYLFAHLIPRQAGFLGVRHTKPNPRLRGHDIYVVATRFRCIRQFLHVLCSGDVERKGEGADTAEGSMEGLKRHGARGRAWSCLRSYGPMLWASH